MDEQDGALGAIAQDPEDLDGHTIEDLADYLDAGRVPVDPTIESSPACRSALAALQRLRDLTAEAVRATDDERADDDWVAQVMSRIALDAHAGADFVLTAGPPDAELTMTEGALRALVRATGDDQPEFLVGRVRFDGDLSAGAEPVTIAVSVIVMPGVVIPDAVVRLRTRIAAAVARHTELQRLRIDVDVQDLARPASDGAP